MGEDVVVVGGVGVFVVVGTGFEEGSVDVEILDSIGVLLTTGVGDISEVIVLFDCNSAGEIVANFCLSS